ncbi:Hypothetical predicted protein [Mytilus galloprovincialis]|uniref:Uncharacterized protein n=1 Tax=Mytilus galloprovincialis TaxID=29158 RepID=A0A8B6DCH0_MYTGA|nr:Hypothetical predicted protein [Mytilus galloprovincialis]
MDSQQHSQQYLARHQHFNQTASPQNLFVPRPYVQTPQHYQTPTQMCYLNCKCCAMFLMTKCACSCNQQKVSIATQTDQVQKNFVKDDYFKPKTSAYQLLQAEITRTAHSNRFHSTSDQGFEMAISSIIQYLGDLQDTPTTREKVRYRLKKRMYNQQGYEKIKNLAQMNGVSVKSCQSAAVKRGLPFTNEPATKQTKNTENSPVSTSVSPINTPIVSPAVTPSISPAVSPSVSPAVTPIVSPAITPIVSPAITPVASPTPSRSSSVTMSSGSPKITEKVFKTANGVTFKIKDVVCVLQIQKHTVTMPKSNESGRPKWTFII